MNKTELDLLENANTIANFEGAVKEARHYIMMGVDNFVINAGDIMIRRKK